MGEDGLHGFNTPDRLKSGEGKKIELPDDLDVSFESACALVQKALQEAQIRGEPFTDEEGDEHHVNTRLDLFDGCTLIVKGYSRYFENISKSPETAGSISVGFYCPQEQTLNISKGTEIPGLQAVKNFTITLKSDEVTLPKETLGQIRPTYSVAIDTDYKRESTYHAVVVDGFFSAWIKDFKLEDEDDQIIVSRIFQASKGLLEKKSPEQINEDFAGPRGRLMSFLQQICPSFIK